ncbi:uncharacterized protein LOC123695222 [Colias croceus]|uniref:uncharacterized protein LOC123695222 n=1 Tax=Colias crocea TaxID=72248 RepID=UPI001E280609|nr:uncharacterized protein LOC123695222 [Colias croceus]
MARDLVVSHSTLQRVVKNELKLTAYKLRKAQRLDDKDKKIRLERCRLLKARSAGEAWKNIFFTDEIFFQIEQSHNHQNDRVYSSSHPGATAIIPHRQKPDSVLVWRGICSTGKTPLVFVKKGVKVNQEIYQRDILESLVLPWSQQHFGDQPWTFQQDSAPSHRASNVQ